MSQYTQDSSLLRDGRKSNASFGKNTQRAVSEFSKGHCFENKFYSIHINVMITAAAFFEILFDPSAI